MVPTRFGVAQDASQPTYSLTLEALEAVETFDSLFHDGVERDGLARVVLEDALRMSMTPKVAPAYLNLLQGAIRAQDRRAVLVLWDGMAPYSNGVTLEWGGVWWRATYEWLIFCVRRPRLVVWLLRQERLLNMPTPPMVAAVMGVLFLDQVHPNGKLTSAEGRVAALPHGGRKWWHVLLGDMRRGLRSRPHPVWLHRPGMRPLCKSLLEVAVTCSRSTSEPVEGMLASCFEPIWLENAWRLMLSRGVLSGKAMLAVSKPLYRAMLESPHPAGVATDQPGTAGRALRVAWTSLMEHSTGWERVPVCFNEERVVWIPALGHQGDDRHPDEFAEVLEHILKAHRAHPNPPVRLIELVAVSFHTAIKWPNKIHLVEGLAHIAHKESDGCWCSASANACHKLIAMQLSHHPTPRVQKFSPLMMEEREGGPPRIKAAWKEAVRNALFARIRNSERDAVRVLVATFGVALGDVVTDELLYEYLLRLCEPFTSRLVKELGDGPHRAWCEQKKRDLQQFLEVGAFGPDALAAALKLAGENGDGVAVEVLASPPHAARTPEDAPFVQSILQELLAPDGEVAREAGEEFSKRQRVSAS
jgi:hypothetical protein